MKKVIQVAGTKDATIDRYVWIIDTEKKAYLLEKKLLEKLNQNNIHGLTLEIEYEEKVGKNGKPYNFITSITQIKNAVKKQEEKEQIQKPQNAVKKQEEVEQQNQKSQPEKTKTFEDALRNIKNVEETINKVVLKRSEMVRLAILNATVGGVVLFVGRTGIAKTMISELVASAFSDKVYYTQFSASRDLENTVGNVDIKKFKEENKLSYNKEKFINSDFHIYDEFYHSSGKLRSVLNDYILRRVLSIDNDGPVVGNTRAIFLTANFFENLSDPKVVSEGGVAIADRILLSYKVPDPKKEDIAEILLSMQNNKKYTFDKPIASVEDLELVRQKALTIKTPKWLAERMAEIYDAMERTLKTIYTPSPRKLSELVNYIKAQAVLNGRDYILASDAEFVLSHSTTHPDRAMVMDIVKKAFEDLNRVEELVVNIKNIEKDIKDGKKVDFGSLDENLKRDLVALEQDYKSKKNQGFISRYIFETMSIDFKDFVHAIKGGIDVKDISKEEIDEKLEKARKKVSSDDLVEDITSSGPKMR